MKENVFPFVKCRRNLWWQRFLYEWCPQRGSNVPTHNKLLLFVWWGTALTGWRRITDKCYHVDSYSDATYWFPSGDDVHFCDCIDTILSLMDLQTEFLEWKGSALFIIYSGLEDVCDFVGLYNYNEGGKKRAKREITGLCPKALSKWN